MLFDGRSVCAAIHCKCPVSVIAPVAGVECALTHCRANLGPKTYLIFAGWMLGCLLVTFFCFPETKGRTPAELDEMFEARVAARQFKVDYPALPYLGNC